MTQNKFWILWNKAGNAPHRPFQTEKEAKEEAYKLTVEKQSRTVVCEAKYVFDFNIKETDLIVPEIDTTAPTETLTPKFKVGDFAMYGKFKYEIHGIALPNEEHYPCGFKGVAYKYSPPGISSYEWIPESELSPCENESPRHDFKVGDKVFLKSNKLHIFVGNVCEIKKDEFVFNMNGFVAQLIEQKKGSYKIPFKDIVECKKDGVCFTVNFDAENPTLKLELAE